MKTFKTKMQIEEIIARVEKFHGAIVELLINLRSRWEDEKGHECIADYALPFEKTARQHEGIKIIKMTGRPFAIQYEVGGVLFHSKCTLTSVQWQRRQAICMTKI